MTECPRCNPRRITLGEWAQIAAILGTAVLLVFFLFTIVGGKHA